MSSQKDIWVTFDCPSEVILGGQPSNLQVMISSRLLFKVMLTKFQVQVNGIKQNSIS